MGLTTDDEKLAAIRQIEFPRTLKQLEYWIGLTGWLRQYVERFAQRMEPLTKRKARLLKECPVEKGQGRKNYSIKTLIDNPTADELQSFKDVKDALSKPTILIHLDGTRTLYIDLDASIEGFGVMVYHVQGLEPRRYDTDSANSRATNTIPL